MYKFGAKSKARMSTCDERIQEILNEAIKLVDFTVLCGHRGESAQNELYEAGMTKVRYPNSRHNKTPSQAVDVAPWPIDWQDRERFSHLAGIIKGIAHEKGYRITWGGDWDGDGELKDNGFDDLPHFQIEG